MKILVTGSHRAGTRFYAKYLSNLHGTKYIDEGEFDQINYKLLENLLKKRGDCVIQGPGLKYVIKEFRKDFPDFKIIWMYRHPKECRESMMKLPGWDRYARNELDRLQNLITLNKIEIFGDVYDQLIIASRKLGKILRSQGIVDEIVNMKDINHLHDFKQTTNKNGT